MLGAHKIKNASFEKEAFFICLQQVGLKCSCKRSRQGQIVIAGFLGLKASAYSIRKHIRGASGNSSIIIRGISGGQGQRSCRKSIDSLDFVGSIPVGVEGS